MSHPDAPLSDAMRILDQRLDDGAGQRFTLLELPPQEVVSGTLVVGGFQAADVTPVGDMRETCPHCTGSPLKLVLRRDHVIRPHLFCPHCTRCFDAIDADGASLLTFYEMPPEL